MAVLDPGTAVGLQRSTLPLSYCRKKGNFKAEFIVFFWGFLSFHLSFWQSWTKQLLSISNLAFFLCELFSPMDPKFLLPPTPAIACELFSDGSGVSPLSSLRSQLQHVNFSLYGSGISPPSDASYNMSSAESRLSGF